MNVIRIRTLRGAVVAVVIRREERFRFIRTI